MKIPLLDLIKRLEQISGEVGDFMIEVRLDGIWHNKEGNCIELFDAEARQKQNFERQDLYQRLGRAKTMLREHEQNDPDRSFWTGLGIAPSDSI